MTTMKNLYDDINTLLNDIKSDIEDVLMNEILDTIKEIELKHIEDDVYSVYKPSVYKRRGNSGGLSDPDNIVGTVKNMELEVENIASFNEDYGSSNKVSNRRLSQVISADYIRWKYLSQSAVNEVKAFYIGWHRRLSRAYFSSAMAGLK